MELTTGQIAQRLEGRLEGSPNVVIRQMASIEGGGEGDLAFVQKSRYVPKLYTTSVSAVLVGSDFELSGEVKPVLIYVSDPYKAFLHLLIEHYSNGRSPVGVASTAVVAPSAEVGPGVFVGDFAYIGEGARLAEGVQVHTGCYVGPGVHIGAGTILYPQVSVYANCVLGTGCRVHSGTVIGSDGFGYTEYQGRLVKVPQIGNVVIGNEVEIGANTTIDRATIGSTRIGSGTKIDNLVHLAHNIEIGENCILAGQVGVAGSVRMGNGVILGGQVGITGHIELADGVQISAKSGLSKSVTKRGAKLRGTPARDLQKQLKFEALQGRIPDLVLQIERLEAQVQALQAQLNALRPNE